MDSGTSSGKPGQGRGITLALYAAISAGAAMLLLVVAGAVWLSGDPRAGGTLRLMRASVAGAFSPAAAAMRDRGCDEAFLLPLRDVLGLMAEFGVDLQPLETDDDTPLALCRSLAPLADGICSEVAQVVIETSTHRPERIFVRAESMGSVTCQGFYAADGSPLSFADPSEAGGPAEAEAEGASAAGSGGSLR